MKRAPGSYAGLTTMQAALLSHLRHWEARGHSPSFQEMADKLDMSSKSHVHRLVSGLEERGYIERVYNGVRSIRVLDKLRSIALSQAEGVADLRRIPTHVLMAEIHRRASGGRAAA